MIKSYKELKEQYPDALVLVRSGQWYVAYEEDAEAVSKILGITLVGIKPNWQAAFPNHMLDSFLPKLVRAGKRIAICECVIKLNELVTPGSKSHVENND
jgi:DNA mismatch repair protein MutS